MRKLIWKIVYKVVYRWEKIAKKNGIHEHVHDCRVIMRHLELYKDRAKKKGMW